MSIRRGHWALRIELLERGRRALAGSLFAALAVLATSGAPSAGAQAATPSFGHDGEWARAWAAARRGDYTTAANAYAQLAAVLPASQAPRALLLEATNALADQNPGRARAALQQVLDRYPATAASDDALLAQARVLQGAGNCDATWIGLESLERRSGTQDLGPYLLLQQARCAADREDWPAARALAERALNAQGPRLASIDAAERAASAALHLGDTAAALSFNNRALDLAGTRNYRAEMLFTTAGELRTLGQTDAATDRFRAVVVDYSDQPWSTRALDQLVDMGQEGTISPLQAGQARLGAGDYREAISQFDQVPMGGPDGSAALLNRALAMVRLGRDNEAIAELVNLASVDPAQTGTALLRAGQVLEVDQRLPEAAAVYGLIPPGDALGAEALFRAGFTRYVQGDMLGAREAWRLALDSGGGMTRPLRARVYLWLGKAESSLGGGVDDPSARNAWKSAVQASPRTYDGLRAADLLMNVMAPMVGPSTRDASRVVMDPAADAAQRAWLRAQGTSPEQLARDLAGEPGLKRADRLLTIGFDTEASWEVEPIAAQYLARRDLAHLVALGEWLVRRDQVRQAMQVGTQINTLTAGATLPVPPMVQGLTYPAGWGDVAYAEARAAGVDPLLLLGLVRQESSFDPRALSRAQAIGLTQVVPGTGQQIARSLGAADFTSSDLYRPAVSLRFGATYLAEQLRRYGGAVLPAIAAYNAGAGNVDRWLAFSGPDPDTFVEQIPFAETQRYVKVVYENYQEYQRLYG